MPLSQRERNELKRRVYEDLNKSGNHDTLIVVWTYDPRGYDPHMYSSEQLRDFCNKLPHPIAKQMALLYLDHVKNIIGKGVRPKAIQRFFPTDSNYALAKQNLQNAVEPDFSRIYHHFRNIINPSEHEWVDDGGNRESTAIYGYPDGTKVKEREAHDGFDLTRFLAENVFPELFCDAVNAAENELITITNTREVHKEACFLVRNSDNSRWFSANKGKMNQIDGKMCSVDVNTRGSLFDSAFSQKTTFRLDLPAETLGENTFSYDLMRWIPAKTTALPFCILENYVPDTVINTIFQ